MPLVKISPNHHGFRYQLPFMWHCEPHRMDVQDKSRVMNCCGERIDSKLKGNWCQRQCKKEKWIVIDNWGTASLWLPRLVHKLNGVLSQHSVMLFGVIIHVSFQLHTLCSESMQRILFTSRSSESYRLFSLKPFLLLFISSFFSPSSSSLFLHLFISLYLY